MTENAPYEKIEREMNSMFTRETVPEPFVCTLRAQLNQKIEQRVSKKRRPFFMRPVWIGLSGLILVMVISTLVIGPERVYAEIRKLLGYIPGMGLVDSSAPIRVLAEPVEQTRDGVTISVVSATLTADRTHIEYRIFGVQRSAYPDREDIPGCMQQEYLLLPDGTRLGRMNDYPAVPQGVNEAVLVIPCIGQTLPGKAPENWEIPLRFVAAPLDFTVMPVEEVTPTATSVNPAGQTTPEPVDTSVSVDKVIDTDKGYILIGKFTPMAKDGEWVQLTGGPVIVDANGKNITYSSPMDVELNGEFISNGGFAWAYEFNAAGVAFPITISFKGVVITQADPGGSAELIFDAGEAPQPGQEWDLNEQITLAGHTLTLVSVTSDSQSDYSFHFQVDPQVYSASVQIAGYTPNGGGGGGGGGLTDGKFSTSIAFAQLPTGKLKLIVSNLTVIGDPLTWQGTWSPATPRTDLPSSQELPAGVCATANTMETLATLPASFEGKALVYEQIPDSDHWGLVLYNLDGSNRTVLTQSGNWGALSPDGEKAVYSAGGGLQVLDVKSGSVTPLNVDGYNPHWSTDGSKIAYIGGAVAGVYVVDVENGKSVQVSALGYESVIGWSPDSNQLYFVEPFTGGAAWKVFSVDLASGAVHERFTIENGTPKFLNAKLSPDGKWIAYRGRDNSSLYLVHPDGSDMHLVLDNTGVVGVVWSQSGWLGVSLAKVNETEQKVIFVDPSTCKIYLAPEITGSLEGLFIK